MCFVLIHSIFEMHPHSVSLIRFAPPPMPLSPYMGLTTTHTSITTTYTYVFQLNYALECYCIRVTHH